MFITKGRDSDILCLLAHTELGMESVYCGGQGESPGEQLVGCALGNQSLDTVEFNFSNCAIPANGLIG